MSENTLNVFKTNYVPLLFCLVGTGLGRVLLLKVVQEFVERFQKLRKIQPDKHVLEHPVQEVIEDKIHEEIARGEEEGRKVLFWGGLTLFLGVD